MNLLEISDCQLPIGAREMDQVNSKTKFTIGNNWESAI